MFSIKRNENEYIKKYQARLVAQGWSQIYDVNYFETFPPVTRYTTIRILLDIAVQFKWLLHILVKEIYMKHPKYFEDEKNPNLVLKLKKSIYGLKQLGRVWNKTLDNVLKKGLE